ncbi:hypothetical protein C627_10690 [Corynebacterium glutamicum ZL-6]|nr:hypothetical protein C627_10690 [Corynebacterium glutamicum ZL-6]
MISAGLLIKYSPHSRGQTFKSNIFLHSNDPNLQKSTTIGQVKAICGVYSHIHSTPGKPKEEHSIPPSNQSAKNTNKKGRMSQPISRILYQLQKQPVAIIHLVAAIADCL